MPRLTRLLSTAVLLSLTIAAPHTIRDSPRPVSAACHGSNTTYRGFAQGPVEGFIGIRFGEDTAGANRFKPPVPFNPPANTVIDATIGGPACPQATVPATTGFGAVFASADTPASISEDCLRLNVWRPRGTNETTLLPVLFWIYGGGYYEGFKDEVDYRPGELVGQSVQNGHPVIHVEINYRLGIFGFARSKALEDEGSENAGVRDQRLALEWVQQNIRSFGGDPSRVTLHGQSAGGCSVGVQTLAYGASKPFPFQQAIFQSEVLDLGITGNATRISTARVVNSTDCDKGGLDSPMTVSCLRGLSTDELLDAQNANSNDVWTVAVDGPGGFLPEAPSSLIRQGRFAHVPAVIGWCEDDGSFFVPNNASETDVAEYFASYLPALTNDSLHQLLALYPSSEFETTYGPNNSIAFTAEGNRASRIFRDILLTCPPMHYGQAISETGAPVYTYLQNATLLTKSLEAKGLYGYGVFHSSEIYYVFGNFTSLSENYEISFTSQDHELRNRQTRSWTSFASVGNPSIVGKHTLQGWELANFTDQNFGAYVIGGSNAGNAGTGGSASSISAVQQQKLQERCAFINSPQMIAQLQY